MRSGGPWNFRGFRPETREAARRSDLSVGDWLNSVIRSADEDDDAQPRSSQSGRAPKGRWRPNSRYDGRELDRPGEAYQRRRGYDEDEPVHQPGGPYRQEFGRGRGDTQRRDQGREYEREREEAREAKRAWRVREAARAREEARKAERVREQGRREAGRPLDPPIFDDACEAVRSAERSDAVRNREELSELHGRLDQISSQLERLARTDIAQRRFALQQRQSPSRLKDSAEEGSAPLTGAPQAPRRTGPRPAAERPPPLAQAAPADRALADERDSSIERAVAEITARQRALAGETSVEAAPREPSPAPPSVPPPSAAPPATHPTNAENFLPESGAASFERERAEGPQPERRQTESPPEEHAPLPSVDLSGLEQQLRQITSRIEALRPASDLEKAIEGIRADLTEIGLSLTEALPRRAVESLEIEVKALAQRIDHSRQCGLDAAALAGLERGLSEVHEALRGLTTAESLVGFDEAVKALTGKVEAIAAKDDPAALRQLEAAIGELRGVVARVASNDALTKVAEDVRALAAKVDGLANDAASGHAVTALESRIDTLVHSLSTSTGADQAVSALGSRIDTLASALNASTEAGHAVPQQLEKLLAGLIEKLEWVQLTHTDHAALAHLEDRIAMLIKRFDASDAHLVHLEAVERGLADLLVHIEQLRNGSAAPLGAGEGAKGADGAVGAIEREVAEIKQTERRTQESLEAVQGTVEHVVDRLAMIESGMRVDKTMPGPTAPFAAKPQEPAAVPATVTPSEPSLPPPAAAASAPQLVDVQPIAARPAAQRSAASRLAIDPDLPPDHPLEPGLGSRSRQPSAADRIAASEAAIGSKPPVIPDPGGKPDFIAAARRAAQAAAATASERPPGTKPAASGEPPPKTLTERLRKLIVPIAVVLIVIGGFRFATRLFEGSEPPAVQELQGEKASAPVPTPSEAAAAKQPADEPDQVSGAGPATNVEVPVRAGTGPSSAPDARPAGQSRNEDSEAGSTADDAAAAKPAGHGAAASPAPDVTGSLPRASAPRSRTSAPAAAGGLDEKLPATIGGPTLRAAALSGDPSAAYEVAMRFAEGRGVPQSNEEAAHWLDRAAKLGLVPAQFRLGGLYEKGIGVKKNLATARDFYRAAADKGHGKAMHNLAVLYAEGIDGAADYRSAAQWFRKAADYGVTDSQYNLGVLYARGIGVEQNFAESYKWFVLAADRGDKDAAKKRDEVAGRLDQQSLAAARAAAQNWTAQPQPADALEVKAWDPPASATPAAKPKPRSAGAKLSSPDTVKPD
jgi:localization factor PodJL